MFRKTLLSLLLLASGLAQAQVTIGTLPPANLPLQSTDKIIVNQTVAGKLSTRASPLSGLAPFFPSLTSHYILQASDPTLTQSRVLKGTANQVIITDGGALGNLTLSLPQSICTTCGPTFSGLTLTGALTGTSAAFSGSLSSVGYSGTTGAFSGALSAGSFSLTAPLPATSGGTGQSGYTIGDLLAADSTITLSRLPDVSAGSYLRSGGINTLPVWSTVKIPNAAVTGDLWYGSAASTISGLTGNITTTKNFLTQTGSGAVSAAPIWGTIAAADLPGSFSGFANPSGTIGLTAVNGAATTAPRSDSAPALSQAISPTWTGTHTFSAATPAVVLNATGAAADTKNTVIRSTAGGAVAISTSTDAAPTTPVKDILTTTRTTTAVTAVGVGNSVDLPPITLNGKTTINNGAPQRAAQVANTLVSLTGTTCVAAVGGGFNTTCVHASTGVYTLTFASAFSGAGLGSPVCNVNMQTAGSPGNFATVAVITTTGLNIGNYTSGTLSDVTTTAYINCIL